MVFLFVFVLLLDWLSNIVSLQSDYLARWEREDKEAKHKRKKVHESWMKDRKFGPAIDVSPSA